MVSSVSSIFSSHLVMKTKDVIVDADFIYLEKVLNWFEHIKHFHWLL